MLRNGGTDYMERAQKGHHLHHTLVGHRVTVCTPGELLRTGLLVSVGDDRLVLNSELGTWAAARLYTTRLEVLD